MPTGQQADTRGDIIALVYSDGARAGRVLQRFADVLRRSGYVCAGLIQHDEFLPGRARCDMLLENLQTGGRVRISDDRGPHARGCRLDPDGLLSAMTEVRNALQDGADVLVLSKFGKSETEGSGFRPLIADAVEGGIALVIGVPARNIEGWHAFSGGAAREIAAETCEGMSDEALVALLKLSRTRT